MRPTTNRTGKRGWPIERIRGWLQTLIRTFPWTLQLRFRWNITRIHILLLRLFKLWPEAIPKQEFVSSFFALQGSSPSKRVPLWSALHSVPSTPSIIFWSRICSILERTGARCLEPTSRTWLETLVSLRLYEASKGRASKETGAWKCTDVRFLDSWSDEDNDEKGLVLRKFRRGDEEANWWTPISTPELPFAAFRPCIIVAFALNTRIPSPSCGNAAVSRIKRPSAYLSYPPRRIPRNSMLGRFLLGCSILEENSLLAGPNLFT